MNDTINYSENKRYDLVKKIDISNFETFFTPFDRKKIIFFFIIMN